MYDLEDHNNYNMRDCPRIPVIPPTRNPLKYQSATSQRRVWKHPIEYTLSRTSVVLNLTYSDDLAKAFLRLNPVDEVMLC